MHKIIRCHRNLTSVARLFAGEANEVVTRGVPLSEKEFRSRKSLQVVQPTVPKVLRVTVIGDPNAGKSTLVNSLSGWRVCSVSSKVHTTRENAVAVFVEDDKQVIFVDTPGLVTLQHGKKHRLEGSLITHPKESLTTADMALVMVDAANRWTRHCLSEHLLDLLREYHTKINTLLVLNKIDQVQNKPYLLDLIRILTVNTVAEQEISKEKKRPQAPRTMEQIFKDTEKLLAKKAEQESNPSQAPESTVGWPHFSRVFAVSALTGEGIKNLRSHLLASCRHGPWQFHCGTVTNQNPKELALAVVREKLLDSFDKQIPYVLQCFVEMWEVDPDLGSIKMAISIVCPKKGLLPIILGPAGNRIMDISNRARQDLSNAFRCDIALKLIVKTKEVKEK